MLEFITIYELHLDPFRWCIAGENDASKAKKKCVPLWDNYCVNKQKCNDKCNGFQGSDGLSYTGGYCALWTCVCCRPPRADEIAPSAPLRPGHNN